MFTYEGVPLHTINTFTFMIVCHAMPVTIRSTNGICFGDQISSFYVCFLCFSWVFLFFLGGGGGGVV